MNKLFKPYLYFVYLLAIVSIILASINNSIVQINLTLILLTIFMVITEINAISTSESSFFSLFGLLSVYSLSITNVFSSIIYLAIALLIVNFIRVYIFNMYDKFINIKSLFNISMHIFCLYTSYIISFNLINNIFLSILFALFIYDSINIFMMALILKLYNNTPISLNLGKDNLSIFTYNTFVLTLLYFGNNAYGIYAILIILLFLVLYQNNTLNKNFEKTIEKTIFYDSLTKAFNRNCLNNDIKDKLINKIPFILLFIDFDNFKYINDKFGHSTGDQVLIHFTKTMKNYINSKIYRFGGDEFCIICDSKEDYKLYINTINKIFEEFKIENEGNIISYTFSIGFYEYNGEKIPLEELFNVASHDMQLNKISKKEKEQKQI